MINISLGNWFRLVLVDFHFGNSLKHGLQNLILIEILIKFPPNPHPKYTECFLVFSVKPGLVVRWYQSSELLGKPELLMLSIEEAFGFSSSPRHSQTQDWVTIVSFSSQHRCHRDLKRLTLFMEQSFWACLFLVLTPGRTAEPTPISCQPSEPWGEADGHCLGFILMLKIRGKRFYLFGCLK